MIQYLCACTVIIDAMCSEYALKIEQIFLFLFNGYLAKYANMPMLFRHSQPPFVHSKIRVCSGIHYFSYFCRKKIAGARLNRLNDAVVTIIHN